MKIPAPVLVLTLQLTSRRYENTGPSISINTATNLEEI